jgi:tetratricopeptide (TPR) repeat protein
MSEDEKFPDSKHPPSLAEDDEDGPATEEIPAFTGEEEDDAEPTLAEEDGPPEDLSEPEQEEGALVFGDGPVDSAGPTFVGDLPAAEEPPDGKTEILPLQEEEGAAPEAVPVLSVETAEGSSDVEVVRDRFVIGRAPGSDVVIPDQAISRSHAALEKRSDGWYVIDLGSGNGTILNGERISEAQILDGDVFTVGNADITFTAPGAGGAQSAMGRTVMLPAAEATATGIGGASPRGGSIFQRRKKFFLIVGSIIVFIGILGIVKKLTQKPPPGPTAEEVAAMEYQAAVEQAEADFEKVKSLVKENRFQEALPIITQINEIIGDRDIVRTYKESIELETDAEKAMVAAQARMAVDDFDQAMAELEKVSPKSVQVEKANDLKKQIEKKRLATTIDAAQKALEAKDYERVVALADQMLQTDPENQQVSAWKRQAETILEKQAAAATKKKRKKKKKKKKVGIAPPPSLRSKMLLAGSSLRAYRSGDLDKAISVVGSSGVSAEGTKQLRKLQKLYKRGIELSRNPGQASQAEKFLSQAYKLDKRLGGGKGKITDQLKSKLAKVYFLKGVDAHNRRKYPEAFNNYMKAKKFRPELKQVGQRLAALDKEARRLYETAYVIKLNQPDKAVSHCQTVMKMVKKNNYAYGRCKKLIEKIQGPAGSSGSGEDEGF